MRPGDNRIVNVLGESILLIRYSDQIDFMQMIPLSPTETLTGESAYSRPDLRRETLAARYLNWRINRRVSTEDKALMERAQAGMACHSYFPVSGWPQRQEGRASRG